MPSIEEDDEITPLVPLEGLQYAEQILYGDSLEFKRKVLKNVVDNVFLLVDRMPESFGNLEMRENHIWEAFQYELIRQFMLGFANAETPDSKNGVRESAAVLQGMKDMLLAMYPNPEGDALMQLNDIYRLLDRSVAYLRNVKGDANYFEYYTQYYNELSGQLGYTRNSVVKESNDYGLMAINLQVRSIFDAHAFNSHYFVPGKTNRNDRAVAELGQVLFFDPALSANNLRACSSCHQPGKAFTDGLPLSQSFEPGKFLKRNAPTLVNSVLQRKLFHDGRSFTFEDQAGQVMSNPLEMHNDFSAVAVKLKNSEEYKKLFREAYFGTEDTQITNRSILQAIAEYERTLIGMNSRFDKTISGREFVMNQDEINGFNLYMGKAACASCHFIPLFNSAVPPEYVETEWEIVGTPSAKLTNPRELDDDLGRYNVIGVDIFRHAFKTPTLRNVAITGPYMHNGVFRTLDEVIEFYNDGGGIGLGYDVPFQTLSEDSLHLTSTEKFELISFLQSLTDTVDITSVPNKLPRFQDGNPLNERVVGGQY
ncbi:MAG: hypothetical protein IPP51_02330 [Bacteroidetes bacterium]|nr:hypothetical protein [Bacteroidota bacterium]